MFAKKEDNNAQTMYVYLIYSLLEVIFIFLEQVQSQKDHFANIRDMLTRPSAYFSLQKHTLS